MDDQNNIIEVKNLRKTYKLYKKRLDRLKDTFLPGNRQYHEPFHALHNISFGIKKGQTVGIVGRNGSGKSTLLQILCGVLQKSSGDIVVDGRVSALLELGAGFNPDFTGRENVFLNGAILGMSRDFIESCLDDILDFADIGHFIDQPVKTYSSGMYVRLAFAVAINVNPDILIVDEALSVGDTFFQAKCFAKFREFQKKGITILFVTHSTDLVVKYCDSAILLDMGKIISQGGAKAIVDTYNRLITSHFPNEKEGEETVQSEMDMTVDNSSALSTPRLDHEMPGIEVPVTLNHEENRYGSKKAEVKDFGIRCLSSNTTSFIHGEEYLFWLKIIFYETLTNPIAAFTIKDVKGFDITGSNTHFQEIDTGTFHKGEGLLVTFTQKLLLNPGGYLLSFGCSGFENGEYKVYDRRFDVVSFEVTSKKLSVGFFDLDSKVSCKRLN